VPGGRLADDLVLATFKAQEPNRSGWADVTYRKTWEGWVHLVADQGLYFP